MKVPSWNIKIIFNLVVRKFHFLKYKNIFQSKFFYFLSSESSILKYRKFFGGGSIYWNTKISFWKNIRIFRARKFHFQGAISKMLFLRERFVFFKKNYFEIYFLKEGFWKYFFWESYFKNVFFEKVILKMYFLREHFWECIF